MDIQLFPYFVRIIRLFSDVPSMREKKPLVLKEIIAEKYKTQKTDKQK